MVLVAEEDDPDADRSTREIRVAQREDAAHLLTSDASSGSASAMAFVLMAPLKTLDRSANLQAEK